MPQKQRIFRLLILLVIGPVSGIAQTQPTTTGIKVQALVSSGADNGVLTYAYTVSNPASNTGAVWVFGIDITQSPGGAVLNSSGLPSVTGFLSGATGPNPTLPSTANAPFGWLASISTDGALEWVAVGTSNKIAPAGSTSGFQLYGAGLPGIRTFFAKPYVDIANLSVTPPNGDPADTERYKNDLDSAVKGMITTDITVGPVAPPAQFNANNFLAIIRGFETQILAHGWVKNSGLLRSLDQKLIAAQAALQRTDNTTAKNVIGAFLNEVDAQADKGLSSEAVALFKYNAQYLISQLQ